MVKTYETGVYVVNNEIITDDKEINQKLASKNIIISKEKAKESTISYKILKSHNVSDSDKSLKIKFDALASHDITYVNIIQTAIASGLENFPIPYVLTNCHNSLCAVGGTINEDDHMFGLSAAKKFGGIYVPAHQAVIHQYMREMMASCGKMILGSDSHTRYGALGTMAIGEGGGEIAKQLLSKTYDIERPEVIAVYLTGKPNKSVGPQDIALAIIGKVFKNGYVKNKIMEFIGDGINNLNVEYRNGIDVMTTETTCLSSIWKTDNKVSEYYEAHGRKSKFKQLEQDNIAYYDGMIYVDMSTIKPMIAMPFHPSNVYEIDFLNNNLPDVLNEIETNAKNELNINIDLMSKIKNGKMIVDQGVIAGCAGGTFDNIVDACDILSMGDIGNEEFSLSIYPSSQPTYVSLVENGTVGKLMETGAVIRSAFCGPCFGAGDVPNNNAFSVRHTTRNFPGREGAKPNNNQIASVALMDARSVAATALNKGILTSAENIDVTYTKPTYYFNKSIYEKRVYNGFNNPDKNHQLQTGPGIVPWPKMIGLTDNILIKIVTYIEDPVTTTDELIPSGETSSFRSNPLGLAQYTLFKKDPEYVKNATAIKEIEDIRLQTGDVSQLKEIFNAISTKFNNIEIEKTSIGSGIFAVKPGDGSAREQAASCQKVLGGIANIANEYATKRYRSNLINWGMLPFVVDGTPEFNKNDFIFIPNIYNIIQSGLSDVKAYIVNQNMKEISLTLGQITDDERKIILAGCLINYYKG